MGTIGTKPNAYNPRVGMVRDPHRPGYHIKPADLEKREAEVQAMVARIIEGRS